MMEFVPARSLQVLTVKFSSLEVNHEGRRAPWWGTNVLWAQVRVRHAHKGGVLMRAALKASGQQCTQPLQYINNNSVLH
jgi:hypothetical protein